MRALLILPLLLIAGCEPTDDVGADSRSAVDATFNVAMIDSMYVPIIEAYDLDPFPGCQKVLSGGHLVLFADGRFTMRLREETIVCDGVARSWGSSGGTGRYVRNGAEISFAFDVGRPDRTGTYSPDGGGTVDGTNFPGPTPIPAITIELNDHRYLLTQDPQELATRP